MKTEINFHEPSAMIPHLRGKGEKLTHLAQYPTSRNAMIWQYKDSISVSNHLVSYDIFPAAYFHYTINEPDRLKISIAPDKLTPTTRKHIYAFIRQFVPAKRAETIINTLRFVFTQPAANKSEYTGEPIYEMHFDIYPE